MPQMSRCCDDTTIDGTKHCLAAHTRIAVGIDNEAKCGQFIVNVISTDDGTSATLTPSRKSTTWVTINTYFQEVCNLAQYFTLALHNTKLNLKRVRQNHACGGSSSGSCTGASDAISLLGTKREQSSLFQGITSHPLFSFRFFQQRKIRNLCFTNYLQLHANMSTHE